MGMNFRKNVNEHRRLRLKNSLTKMLCLVIAALATWFPLEAAASHANPITGIGFLVNGRIVSWDRAEFGAIEVINGRTMLPLRIVSNKLGYEVDWDGATMTAIVKKGALIYRFPLGKPEILTPSGMVPMDVPNTAINGRTYLPIRAFFETFGLKVDWKSSQDAQQNLGIDVSSQTDSHYVVVTSNPEVDAVSSATKRSTSTSKQRTGGDESGAETKAAPVKSAAANSDKSVSTREIEMKEKLVELKKAYPDGLAWFNENRRYEWNDTYEDVDCYVGTGCVAFAFEISDKLFERTEKARRMEASSVDQIRIGDIIRMNDNSHSAVVIDRDETGITLAEGNVNKAVMWGRKLTYEELREVTDYYITRYK